MRVKVGPGLIEAANIESHAEDETTARARFTYNYYTRGGTDAAWLNSHIEPLIKIAVPELLPPHPKPARLKGKPQPGQPHTEVLPWGPDRFLEFYSEERAPV